MPQVGEFDPSLGFARRRLEQLAPQFHWNNSVIHAMALKNRAPVATD